MTINGKKIFLFLVFSILFLSVNSFVKAQTCGSQQECNDLINQYTTKLTQLQGQANTLKNQIAQFDYQIKLTTLKIQDTESKIALLGGRINQLEGSLNDLTNAFS